MGNISNDNNVSQGGVNGNSQDTTNNQAVPQQPQSVGQGQQIQSNVQQAQELTDKIHPDDLDVQWSRWKCLSCEYLYEGNKPLEKCPRCGNDDPDKFDDAD